MTSLDDFFTKTTEFSHPRLRDWKRRLSESGMTAKVEVHRSAMDLGQPQSVMYIHFEKSGVEQPIEEVSWDDELNLGLIQLKIPAISHANESVRFSLGLRAAMRKPERAYGDGYFNAVLIDLVRDSDLTRYSAIDEVLHHVHTNSPHRDGGPTDSYTICREWIAEAIGGRAKELTHFLSYSQGDAKVILTEALALYLDERFSVSARRRMGWL